MKIPTIIGVEIWNSNKTVCTTKNTFIIIITADRINAIKIFILKQKIHETIRHYSYIRLTTCKILYRIFSYRPFTNSPIIQRLLVNASTGIMANGNCKLIIAFKISFIPLRSFILVKYAR